VTRTDAFAPWLGGTSISIDGRSAGTHVFPGAVIVRRACAGVLFAIRVEESVALEGFFIADDAFSPVMALEATPMVLQVLLLTEKAAVMTLFSPAGNLQSVGYDAFFAIDG
jgi:hypothetical protein